MGILIDDGCEGRDISFSHGCFRDAVGTEVIYRTTKILRANSLTSDAFKVFSQKKKECKITFSMSLQLGLLLLSMI